MTVKILVVDNYDSFVYTLVGYLQQLGRRPPWCATTISARPRSRSWRISTTASCSLPGPAPCGGRGVRLLVRRAERTGQPLFGVCLGHQSLGQVFGGTVGHSEQLMHGKTSEVSHEDDGIFAGVPSPFIATRYHSLSVSAQDVPEVLRVTA